MNHITHPAPYQQCINRFEDDDNDGVVDISGKREDLLMSVIAIMMRVMVKDDHVICLKLKQPFHSVPLCMSIHRAIFKIKSHSHIKVAMYACS